MFTQSTDIAKKCEILLIGNELLIGKTRDLNLFWLGKQISPFGISVTRAIVIHDDIKEIESTIREMLAREPDYIFTSGGLGPTFDDETMEGIARGLDRELYLDETVLDWLTQRYQQGFKAGTYKDPGMNESRKKMAYLPVDSTPLHNNAGAAPGVMIVENKTKIFILPGVPRELQTIFSEEIAPILLEENATIKFHEFGFRVDGVGESAMSEQVNALMKEIDDRIWIKSHAKHDGTRYYVEMDISGYGDDAFRDDVESVALKVRQILEDLGGIISESKNEEE
ncbi:MAG TPA: molybdopterin-binding protein [Candidatus Lokiarchaeia archaeon]|nr:molybdopterin-binding protein [Candidatus Lokiarchaeia archaeon]